MKLVLTSIYRYPLVKYSIKFKFFPRIATTNDDLQDK